MPAQKYVFADLDVNQDVREHMQAHFGDFSTEALARQFPLDAHKLTKLLAHPNGSVAFYRGVYFRMKVEDVEAFKSAGWDLRPKSAREHRTLENLLKRNLAASDNGASSGGKKTLVVMGGGDLTLSLRDRVVMHFNAGWCVQLFCFRDKGSEVADRFRSEYASRFQNIYLGGYVKTLLISTSQLEQQVQHLQEEFIGLKAKVSANRSNLEDKMESHQFMLDDACKDQLVEHGRMIETECQQLKRTLDWRWRDQRDVVEAEVEKVNALSQKLEAALNNQKGFEDTIVFIGVIVMVAVLALLGHQLRTPP